MVNAQVRKMLEREIQRVENHLQALYDILDEVDREVPKRKIPENVNSRIPTIEKALAKVRGDRTFSVKEVNALALRIDPEVDRRVMYNCIKGYLQRNLDNGVFEQVSGTEYRKTIHTAPEVEIPEQQPRRTRPTRR